MKRLPIAPHLDRQPAEDEVAYVPGPLQEAPPKPGLLKLVQEQVTRAQASHEPRTVADDVALAKQALLEAAHAPKPKAKGGAAKILRQHPKHLVIGVVAFAVLLKFVPASRAAMKAGIAVGLKIAATKAVKGYLGK